MKKAKKKHVFIGWIYKEIPVSDLFEEGLANNLFEAENAKLREQEEAKK